MPITQKTLPPADAAVTLAKLDPAVVVTSSETIGSNNNDTTIPTSAAVKAYADATVGGGGTPSDSTITTAKFTAATLVTASEGVGSNNNDTTIPTSAAVKAYADSVAGTLYPYHVQVLPTTIPTAFSPAATILVQSGAYYATAVGAGVNINNYMEWDFLCAAGTYTLRTMYGKAINAGIITISIDGVDLGTTIDTYATFAAANISDITGIALTAGRHAIRYRVAAKNASSSNYEQKLSGFAFTRTGA